MSDVVDDRVLPVTGMVAELKRGGEVDVNQNVKSMMTIDENLPMITNISDSMLLSGFDAFAQYLIDRRDYEVCGRTVKTFLKWYRVNQTSLRGWRSEQIERMIKAFGGASPPNDDDIKRDERLMGKR